MSPLKLAFEPNLDFQLRAIESVRDLFRGQRASGTTFAFTPEPSLPEQHAMITGHNGVGNQLTLLDDEILKNLREVQLRNGLAPSSSFPSSDFTVEMETGTGKTYVYLRTIFELNRAYGFTKFVIVVPSLAIKEGVYKSLQIMSGHFRSLYAGTPFEYFLYDSAKLGQVRNFATSPHIQVMVVTVGAINKKDVNNLYKDSEKTGGDAPIDLIRATRPVVIVDEPQSVDGGLHGRGRQALEAMHPLCTLRYSATHVNQHNMVYRLDAIDAYEGKLVKQIEVASATVEDAYNTPYVRLLSTRNHRNTITATLQLDVATATGVRRRKRTVQDGDDLESITRRAIYRNCRIGEIRVEGGNEFVELRVPGDEVFLVRGQSWGDVEPLAIQKAMIRRTIQEHLEKEKRLHPQGIKVLSLFFVDHVDRYRSYDDEGHPEKGVYAKIFEKEYRRAARHPDYEALFRNVALDTVIEQVHDGYFSIDKRGGWTDTSETNQASRENAERAYNLIMRDKEKLLSLDTPLKFIFSHSALREGWDNPNVFQICALRDIHTELERRQTIGRGLRLCVDQNGDRISGFDVNTLTVIAGEDYEEFAESLQREIEADTGIRFGIVEAHQFATIPTTDDTSQATVVGFEASKSLWEHLKAHGYIDEQGQIQESLRRAILDEALSLPHEFESQRIRITALLRKLAGRLQIKNADQRRIVRPRQAVLQSAAFKALWERIKHKTTYRVVFDNKTLLEKCTSALQDAPPIPRTRLQWRIADIAVGHSGIKATEREMAGPVTLDGGPIFLPDLLTELQNQTHLTRRSLQRILVDSGRLDEFKRNPQRFMELASQAINQCKRLALVDGIRYQRVGDDHYYAQELFEREELTGYLKNLMNANKSIYEQTAYESTIEKTFAAQLEKNTAVRVYAKLPGWFTVPTPLGTYNPDWAVLIEDEGGERLYFVVETKGSQFAGDLRDPERAKIACGEKHFEALEAEWEPPARYAVATSVEEFLAGVISG